MKTIDCTPSWSSLMPWILRVIEDPNTSEKAKEPLRQELLSLAKKVDELNKNAKGE